MINNTAWLFILKQRKVLKNQTTPLSSKEKKMRRKRSLIPVMIALKRPAALVARQ